MSGSEGRRELVSENIQYRIHPQKSRETEPLVSKPVASKASRFSRACCSCNWKNVFVAVCLWLTYMFCSIAYSIIAPFFPDEVSHQ